MKRVATAALVAFAIFACGKERNGFSPNTSTPFEPDSGTPAGCESGGLRCSRDLRAIVESCDESRVVKACGANEGCSDARCVPACEITSASTGCEFVAVPPTPQPESAGSCFAAIITNTWETPARIEADYEGAPLDLLTSARIVRSENGKVVYAPFPGELAPGEVGVLFLSATLSENSHHVACPLGVIPALADTARNGTRRGSAIQIKTTAPVSAYSIYPFGGASSFTPGATLLLPVGAWKTSYVVTSPAEVMRRSMPAYAATHIVAAEDDTDVVVVASQHIQPGRNVEGASPGVPKTYKLRRGEQLQFEQDPELTGTLISATKKIGVWSSHACMDIPTRYCCCDSSHLQLFPVGTMGREYAVVPYLARAGEEVGEDYLFRITGAVDGTVLTYEPSPPEGAPLSVNAGESIPFTSRKPFVVRSQDSEHPIGVYAFMTGPIDGLGEGDPEFTSVVPTEQYLGRYIFFIDPTYSTSHLVVIRSREEGKDFQPVVLDCAGTLDGWQALGTSGKHEYTRVRLTKDFVPQVVGAGKCEAGRHVLESPGPVAVTVWGTDKWASYAYPGGSAIRPLNNVDPVLVK
ncbi:MAG: hypothetical protein BGO98_19070 [Myxococcales bacterium 68-20]|nr:MAG: hypothetical protein BGO98_19070 [Myxococcales bacterium 68-20]